MGLHLEQLVVKRIQVFSGPPTILIMVVQLVPLGKPVLFLVQHLRPTVSPATMARLLKAECASIAHVENTKKTVFVKIVPLVIIPHQNKPHVRNAPLENTYRILVVVKLMLQIAKTAHLENIPTMIGFA